MNKTSVFTWGGAEELEAAYHRDPQGFVAEVSEDSSYFDQLLLHVIDSRSVSLGEALCAYMIQPGQGCLFYRINAAAISADLWKRNDASTFSKEFPGELGQVYEDQAVKVDSGKSSNALRAIYKALFKWVPDTRLILRDNFLSYDVNRSIHLAPLTLSDESEVMMSILNYLRLSPEAVRDRIYEVFDEQINYNSKLGTKAKPAVDVGLITWLKGYDVFDLDYYSDLTSLIDIKSQPTAKLIEFSISALGRNTPLVIARKILGNLDPDHQPTGDYGSLGFYLADWAANRFINNGENKREVKLLLEKRIIKLDEMDSFFTSDSLAEVALQYSGFSVAELRSQMAGRSLIFDKACVRQWLAGTRRLEKAGQRLSEQHVEDLADIIRSSNQPFTCATLTAMASSGETSVIRLLCEDPGIKDLLLRQSLTEEMDVFAHSIILRKAFRDLCDIGDKSYANQAFMKLLSEFVLRNQTSIVDLSNTTFKLSADTVSNFVAEMPYRRYNSSLMRDEENIQDNSMYKHVLETLGGYQEIYYATLDRLQTEFEWYFISGTEISEPIKREMDSLLSRFREHQNRGNICSLDDRIRLLEYVSFIGVINPFQFQNNFFVEQSWARLIDALSIEPGEVARRLATDNATRLLKSVFDERGQGQAFVRSLQLDKRDAVLGADLGL